MAGIQQPISINIRIIITIHYQQTQQTMNTEPTEDQLDLPPTTCYFHTSPHQQCPLPLLSTHYSITVHNNFSQLTLEQTYHNPFDKALEIHYAIPTDPEFSISGLEVCYQEGEVSGVVMEREKAKFQYKKALEKGDTVTMANYGKNQSSVLKLRIGNIEAQEKIKIRLQLIGPLNVQTGDEWVLRIPSHIGPRYTSIKDLLPKLFNRYLKSFQDPKVHLAYLESHIDWSFSLNLNCSQKIKNWQCDTHSFKATEISPNSYRFLLENGKELPEVDLEFRYTRDNEESPMVTYGASCMGLTFQPLEIGLKKSDKGVDFIFLLDRSGSMTGPGIESAKKALTIYLKSLPEKSKFNIISFGSSYEKMFPQSLTYTQQTVQKAIAAVQTFTANLGGTQILEPLKNILDTATKQENWERHIILLTDGQVSNTNQVVETIGAISKKGLGNVHTIGVGSGFSMDLVKRGAEAGEGYYLAIVNANNMSGKIIGLLESILKPKLTNFTVNYNKALFQEQDSKIPEKLSKGRPNTIYLAYSSPREQIFEKQIDPLTIKYFDEEKQQEVEQKISLDPTSIFEPLDKFYAKCRIDRLLENPSNDNKAKAIELSISSQVLCKLTALFCKVKQNPNPTAPKQAYYLKMKTALQGKSALYQPTTQGDVHVKTLTGKTLTFTTRFNITVEDLKEMVQETEGIPVDQQRMIFAGKQMDNGMTLEELGMAHESTAHLVLRLRGGDGGSCGPAKFCIVVEICGKTVTLREPQITPDSTVSQLLKQLSTEYPTLKKLPLTLSPTLTHNNTQLSLTSKLNEIPLPSGSRIVLSGIPAYLLNPDELIKLMRINGSWAYDGEMLGVLDLGLVYEEKLKKYGEGSQGKDKAMTEVLVGYLRKNFVERKEEYALIYKKAAEFLVK